MRTVKTNDSNNPKLDEKVAKVMGLKINKNKYRSLDPVQRTTFTSPPSFSTNPMLVNYMIKFAKEKGIKLPKWTYEPEKIAQAIAEYK